MVHGDGEVRELDDGASKGVFTLEVWFLWCGLDQRIKTNHLVIFLV